MRELTLTVPSPAEPSRLDRFLCAHLHGLSRRAVKGILDAGQVQVGGRTERKAGRPLRPGDVVVLTMRPSMLPCPSLALPDVVQRGDGWLALHKPAGLPSHRPDEDVPGVPERLAELLGGDATQYRPAHRLDRATSGVLLVALDDARAASLSQAFADRAVAKTYLGVVSPGPNGDSGELTDRGDDGEMHLRWSVRARSSDGQRAELEVVPRQGRTHQIRRQLAGAGMPLVGDLLYGRALPGGAPRMGLHCLGLAWGDQTVHASPPPGWAALLNPDVQSVAAPRPKPALPREAATRPAKRSRGFRTLTVSSATARMLAGGHPWVLPDRDTGSLAGFSAGDQALLVDQRGREVGVALIDPSHGVVARLLDPRRTTPLGPDDFAARARRALHRRKAVLADTSTNCGRLIHGEADGLPGLVVDRWADRLVVTRSTEACDVFQEPVLAELTKRFPEASVYQKDHIVDLRRRGRGKEGDLLPGRVLSGVAVSHSDSVLVAESGLSYRVEPYAGLTTGLYPDQRSNRAGMTSRLTPASRVLNLFAHTAAFSVAAAAAGASETVSVDLSPRYCAWADENLARNGFDGDAHRTLPVASGAFVDSTAERFHGVIVDPPAFARGRKGDRGWNARRDYRDLIRRVARVLDPGPSWLLCIINLKGLKPSWLRTEVDAGLRAGGRPSVSTTSAPPAPDFPTRKGFPEGRAFLGVWVEVGPA